MTCLKSQGLWAGVLAASLLPSQRAASRGFPWPPARSPLCAQSVGGTRAASPTTLPDSTCPVTSRRPRPPSSTRFCRERPSLLTPHSLFLSPTPHPAGSHPVPRPAGRAPTPVDFPNPSPSHRNRVLPPQVPAPSPPLAGSLFSGPSKRKGFFGLLPVAQLLLCFPQVTVNPGPPACPLRTRLSHAGWPPALSPHAWPCPTSQSMRDHGCPQRRLVWPYHVPGIVLGAQGTPANETDPSSRSSLPLKRCPVMQGGEGEGTTMREKQGKS